MLVSSNLRRFVERAGSRVADFAFPPECVLCRCDLPPSPIAERVCGSCQEEWPAAIEYPCQRCGAESGPYASTADGCPHCQNLPASCKKIIAYGMYENKLRELCTQCKLPHFQPTAQFLARCLWNQHESVLRTLGCEVVVPVPMHWSSRFRRKTHPNETVARFLAARLQIPCSTTAVRQIRRIERQHLLSPSRRRKNVQGAFACRTSRTLQGRKVLLVDDILTTGATAHACAQALKPLQCEIAGVAVLARAVGR
ncbi:ComF family protein [Rubinisphaera margarita]|uniref:ComF family protein n=1 Tax=Rubinisphaera margarita TaxID=2909586 RepID=UPI001EE8EE24|nr:phosphoribosyltransferase family protein [Rubinisphaera margarita]MCG6157179.1 hypothetical protein [Rubinisphaera margarita]